MSAETTPHTAYEAKDIGSDRYKAVYVTGFRSIQFEKFLLSDIERRFPNQRPDNPDSRVALYTTFYSNPHVSPEEALTMLEQCEGKLVRSDPVQASRTETRAAFQRFEIEPERIAHVVKEHFSTVIDDLGLPARLGARAKSVIANMEIVIDYDGESPFTHEKPVQEPGGKAEHVVVLNMQQILRHATEFAKIARTELTFDLLNSYVTCAIAHELGHGLNHRMSTKSIYDDATVRTASDITLAQIMNHTVTKFMPAGQTNFPITWVESLSLESHMNQMKNWDERFAVFFEHEVARSMGVSTQAITDDRQILLSQIAYLLEKIPPHRWAQLREAAIHAYPKDHPLRTQILQDVELTIGGYQVAQCLPFSREEVVAGFLEQYRRDTFLYDQTKKAELIQLFLDTDPRK
jgi:hypothetical protein